MTAKELLLLIESNRQEDCPDEILHDALIDYGLNPDYFRPLSANYLRLVAIIQSTRPIPNFSELIQYEDDGTTVARRMAINDQ